jgi:hypothetical protein
MTIVAVVTITMRMMIRAITVEAVAIDLLIILI